MTDAAPGRTTKSIDAEIAQVLAEIKEKDDYIRLLHSEKEELYIRYEELKAARLRSQSQEMAAEHDWESGENKTNTVRPWFAG